MPILPTEPEMYPDDLWEGDAGGHDTGRRWYCLHTRPRQEKVIARDLRASKIAFYLPQMVREGRTPQGRKTRSTCPLFNGYLFLLGNELDRFQALRGDRLVSILDVADQGELIRDLGQIHQMLGSGLAIDPERAAPVGSRVRIVNGPLSGVIGIVARRGQRDRFTAAIRMLGVGATVTLEDWQVEILPD